MSIMINILKLLLERSMKLEEFKTLSLSWSNLYKETS